MVMIVMVFVGVVMIFIVLFIGVVWGKFMWGVWWVWDVRFIFELILLFLYIGVIVLYGVFEDK